MSELKPGDTVVVRNFRGWEIPYTITTAVKVTKTQVEVTGGTKYMRGSGRIVGSSGSLYDPMLTNMSAEDAKQQNTEWQAEHDHKSKVNSISAVSLRDWRLLTNSELDHVLLIVETAKARTEERAGTPVRPANATE